MDHQQNESTEHQMPFRKILTLYFKANKKRVVSILIISSIFFLILSTIVLVSFSLYQDSFYKYIETNHNWLNDNEISVISRGSIIDSEILTPNYLMNGINEVETKLDEIMPNVLKSSTGVLEITLNNFISINNYFEIFLSTYDDIAINQIKNNLLSGRLPENSTEILFYDALNQSSYEIGAVFNLTGKKVYNNYPIITKCQVVGIVKNVESIFHDNNLSTDILRETENYFITTSDYFYDLVNRIDNKSNHLDALIDFDYTFTIQQLRTEKYLRELNEYDWEDKAFVYLPNPIHVSFCKDLYYALNHFEMEWYLQIFKQLSICFPLILLIGFIGIELYRTFNFEKRVSYRLLKIHGVDEKSLNKTVFFENQIIIGSGLIIGLSISLIIAYFIVQLLDMSSNVSIIAGFSNPTSIILILCIYFTFLFVNYFIDIIQLKKAKVTIMEQYKTKKRRFLSKIFSLPELNFLIPGIPLTIFGLLLSYIVYDEGRVFEYIKGIYFFIGFSIMAFIGIVFVLFAVIFFLRRIMIYLWNRLGDSFWKRRKGFFAFSLKQLSVYIRDYKNTIMVFFLIGLCITPGLVMKKSVESHNELEANLSVGCSDILVENWNIEESLEVNISKIEGIELTTVVSKIELYLGDSSSIIGDSRYYIDLYVLANISEFTQIVDFSLLNQDGYSKEDISQLDSDLSYIMNRKYARKNNYNTNENFTTVGITPSVYQPKELVYINDFSYFPLVPLRRVVIGFGDYFDQPTYIELVVSNQTKDQILEYNQRERIQKNYLLIKTADGANITAIKEEITSKYQLTAYTLEDFQISVNSTMNLLGLKLFSIISIITIALATIYGWFKAVNIYKERQPVIEILIQNGAKRWFIVSNFTIELILVIPIPIIFSLGIAIPYLNNFGDFMMNVVTNHIDFTIWYPWWIFILTGLFVLITTLIGWWISSTYFVKSYKLHKIE